MKRYRIGFHADFPHLARPPQSLAQKLAEALPDLIIEELRMPPAQAAQVSFALEREDDATALNEVFLALQQLGYSIAEASVSEWVDARVSGAIVGAISAGGAGSKGGGWTALLAGGFGYVAGLIAGSAIRSERVLYRAEQIAPGQWELREVTDEQLNPLLTPALG